MRCSIPVRQGRGLPRPSEVLKPWLCALIALSLMAALALCAPSPLRAQAQDPAASSAAESPLSLGSYDVAPVRILGVPAISVAAPVLRQGDAIPDAQQRAGVIEGNLSLLYEPHGLCTPGEGFAEAVLEAIVLRGPEAQRLCNGNPWALLGRPGDLRVVVRQNPQGNLALLAALKGRPEPLPLLNVTEADAQLHGLSRPVLAERWRQILQRRLRHARRTEQPDQIALRLRFTLLAAALLAASAFGSFQLWSWLRRRLRRHLDLAPSERGLTGRHLLLSQWLLRGLFVLILAQLVAMVAFVLSSVPGRIPLAVTLLLQPLFILGKVVELGLVALALRLLAQFVLHQWSSNLSVPLEERARRLQRYRNLRQVSQRLIDLGCIAVLIVIVLADVPGVRELTLGAWLAGGALLGGLVIAFQGLLRDGVAGLVALLDDHYAVGDVLEVNGVVGEVVDVGLFMTELRSADQRVVLFANSSPQQLVNHTKIRSGIELLIPLAERPHQLERAVAVLESSCEAFAKDPHWSSQLLAAPLVRGVKRLTPGVIELSVLLTTRTGRQWEAQRALLRRLVVDLQQADVVLAGSASGGPA